jgi:hypothetical protein
LSTVERFEENQGKKKTRKMNTSGERILDLDIPQETTLNSPLIFSNPRKNQRNVTMVTMVPENPPLESIRSLESFRAIEENTPLENGFTSSFSRTPGKPLISLANFSLYTRIVGPKSTHMSELMKSPEIFNLFPDQGEKGRFLNYSDFKSNQENISSSPLVQGMIAELLTSFSPTPDKLARTFSLSDKSDSGAKEKRIFENVNTPVKREETFESENSDFFSQRWISPNASLKSRPTNNQVFLQVYDSANKAEEEALQRINQFNIDEDSLPPLKPATEWEKNSIFSHMSSKEKSNFSSGIDSEKLGWRSHQSTNSLVLDIRSSNESKGHSKQDLLESPRSKSIFKEFSSKFRQISKRSSLEAENFALNEVEQMGEPIKYKVYLELAELSKKNDDSEKVIMMFICILLVKLFLGSRLLYSSCMQ